MHLMKPSSIALALVVLATNVRGQEWLDAVDNTLSLKTRNGLFRADLTGLLDLEAYYVDQRPPGLLFEDESFFNYRLTFFVDASLGPHLYSFVQARLDRGFNPGEEDFQARMDEYLLRWIPWDDSRLNLQFGKFATVVGNWVQRHYSWDNPLIIAPMPYDTMTVITADYPPATPAGFLYRRGLPDYKDEWRPATWGPRY